MTYLSMLAFFMMMNAVVRDGSSRRPGVTHHKGATRKREWGSTRRSLRDELAGKIIRQLAYPGAAHDEVVQPPRRIGRDVPGRNTPPSFFAVGELPFHRVSAAANQPQADMSRQFIRMREHAAARR